VTVCAQRPCPSNGVTPGVQPQSKHSFRTACQLLLGLSLLALVLWRNWDPPGGTGLARMLSGPIRAVPLLLATVFYLFNPLCVFVRWYWLVRAQGLPFRLRDAFRLGCVGLFWNTVLPGSVGGDVVKATLLAREQRRRTAAVATVLVDRLIGLVGIFFLVGCVGSACWLGGAAELQPPAALQPLVMGGLGVTAGALLLGLLAGFLPESAGQQVCGWLSRLPAVGSVAAELCRALWMYRSRRACVFGAVLLAALAHVSFLLNFHFAAQVFASAGESGVPSLAEHFLIIPAGLLFQAVFPSPGGVGGGEYGFGQLYALLGKPAAQGVLGSLAVRAITWGVSLACGLVYLIARSRWRQASVQPIHRPLAPALLDNTTLPGRDDLSRLAG
jgi:uncharacterized membrane protein YbhN (UPF0104 family)